MSDSRFEWFLNGSVTLWVTGPGARHIVAWLQQDGVVVRDVRFATGGVMLRLGVSALRRLMASRRDFGVRFRVVERHGAPFLARRLRRRKAFAAGALAFVAILYALSSIVWRVEIVGAEGEDQEAELRQAAAEAGLEVGQWKSRLAQPAELAERVVARAPNYVWVGVEVKGSVAVVRGIPKIPGVPQASQTPCNIVATRPGVILDVQASRGRVMVKPNQVVQPGQVLISGLLTDRGPSVPASGSVFAEVWYTSDVSIPLQISTQGLTGASVSREYLAVGGTRLRVWGFQEAPSGVYERDAETDWHIGTWRLPVQWVHATLYEVKPTVWNLDVAAAKQEALVMAASDVRSLAGGDMVILGQSVLQERLERGTLYATILTRVQQDIGAPAPIPEAGEPLKSQGAAQS
ncbi:sporulation protein YqfD [Alicyclobacillus mali]|uniref:Sporulation protein YqfD n=1 Tax=Alicyclobacillus mali (ex Roth et al. 2021) TaxID=1123961 RepID=A0ABS0F4M5_9BACL|nr:sporulation protein YqfD [Alicyclobacillus mali (ex Roth et al. 2021)]MBF8378259.1 sporulation protein YqfD [Alicyclobacillus mali (ex Roth et al. 2021)]